MDANVLIKLNFLLSFISVIQLFTLIETDFYSYIRKCIYMNIAI